MRCKKHASMTIDKCVGCMIAKNNELAKEWGAERAGHVARSNELRDKLAAAEAKLRGPNTIGSGGGLSPVQILTQDRDEWKGRAGVAASQHAAAEAENERLRGGVVELRHGHEDEGRALYAALAAAQSRIEAVEGLPRFDGIGVANVDGVFVRYSDVRAALATAPETQPCEGCERLHDKLMNGLHENEDGTFTLVWTAKQVDDARREAKRLCDSLGFYATPPAEQPESEGSDE